MKCASDVSLGHFDVLLRKSRAGRPVEENEVAERWVLKHAISFLNAETKCIAFRCLTIDGSTLGKIGVIPTQSAKEVVWLAEVVDLTSMTRE
jgi:hypothetical protein